jgi:hypothetical protein
MAAELREFPARLSMSLENARQFPPFLVDLHNHTFPLHKRNLSVKTLKKRIVNFFACQKKKDCLQEFSVYWQVLFPGRDTFLLLPLR